MTRRAALGAGGLALLGALALAVPPLAAQTDAPPVPEDIPIIDLGPVLGATADLPGDAAPDPDAAAAAVPGAPPPLAVPEAELTLPQYDRGAPPGADVPAPRQTMLLPLRADRPTRDGITRLSGEVQRAGFFLDLPVGADVTGLRIAYRIAINVLPPQSELRVILNGTALNAVEPGPDAFEGFVPIALPADLLVEGRNRLVVEVRHAHRIFCGPDATFAVWTEIDTGQSGAEISSQTLGLDAAGLALAIRAQLAQGGRLPVRLARPEDGEILGGFATRLAALRDGAPVVLSPEPPYGVNPEQSQRARITVLPYGPPLAEVRRGADGAVVLVLAGGDEGVLPDLDGLLPLPEPVPGNPTLVPGAVTPLSALTDAALETYNRYAEIPVLFQMPEDWLTLASQKALIRLGYGFADGLPEGALMLVKVNDTTVRLLPLDRGATDARDLLDVGFPARLLRPGVNALTFVAIVPGDPPDLPCPPIVAPLLTIDPATTIEVPPTPRMAMPGLGAPLRALRPDQVVPPQQESAFSLGQRDMLAALSSALRPIGGTRRLDDASLTVTRLGDSVAVPLDRLGLARRDLDRLLTPAATAAPTPAEVAPPPTGAGLRQRALDLAERLHQLAMPGDPRLGAWLADRHALAALMIPDPVAAPNEMWLVLGPDTDAATLGPLLAESRSAPKGPQGQLSVLGDDLAWHSWSDKSLPPVLLEPLGLSNFRLVAGNYASWSPLYFGLSLFALTLVSVGLALIFVTSTRGRRKKR